jgi:hypothetical protein
VNNPKLNRGRTTITTDVRTIRRTVVRLVHEASNLKSDLGAIRAISTIENASFFLQIAARGLQSDLLVRLIRVFEWDERVTSLWYLYDKGLCGAVKERDINRLKSFSKRLKKIRDSVFIHIDARAIHDPQREYRRAKIKWAEIAFAIESLSKIVTQLYLEQHKKPFADGLSTVGGLTEIYSRDLLQISRGVKAT